MPIGQTGCFAWCEQIPKRRHRKASHSFSSTWNHRNNYDKEVFNGDIGHIASVDLEDQRITVEIDGHRIRYEFLELEELVHAYACSIHKSQGSEYPAVVILLTTQHFKLLQRNLLYTAITRGRELVCVVGSTKAVYIATQNNEIRQRRTALAERLAE